MTICEHEHEQQTEEGQGFVDPWGEKYVIKMGDEEVAMAPQDWVAWLSGDMSFASMTDLIKDVLFTDEQKQALINLFTAGGLATCRPLSYYFKDIGDLRRLEKAITDKTLVLAGQRVKAMALIERTIEKPGNMHVRRACARLIHAYVIAELPAIKETASE